MGEREEMGKKDDGLELGLGLGLGLGLSMSLGYGTGNQGSVENNPSNKPSQLVQNHIQKGPWNEMYQLPGKTSNILRFCLF